MPTFFTLHPLDIAAIVGYVVAVMAIAFWASRRVKGDTPSGANR